MKRKTTLSKIVAIILMLGIVISSLAACSGSSSTKKKSKDKNTDTKKTRKTEDDNDPEPSDDDDPKPNDDDPSKPDDDDKKPVEQSVRIVPTEAASVQYEQYTSPAGDFTMMIPQGWKVIFEPSDYIQHYFIVYDPQNPCRRIVMQLLSAGVYDEHSQSVMKAYGTYAPVYSDLSTTGFFQAFGTEENAPYLVPESVFYNFSPIENLGTGPYGGDLILGTCNAADGTLMEMLCTADLQTFFLANDVTGVYVHMMIELTAKAEEFPDWEPVLTYCYGTVNYTQEFIEERNRQWQQVQNAIAESIRIGEEIADMISEAYWSRQTTYDIISQKTSDSILGYERIEDTETGKIYRCEPSFLEDYDGTRYKKLDDDSDLYNRPVDGYIYWE
ncbi:MAG: hypothetical protein IK020_12935 [Clostridiales bacterium]|nr:hypothetical protein [Clostridiales bacterium]